MKRLYRAAHLIEASHLKSLLDSARIDTFLRNEDMMRAVDTSVSIIDIWFDEGATTGETRRPIGSAGTAFAETEANAAKRSARCRYSL